MNNLQKQQIRCDEVDKRYGLLSRESLIEYDKLYQIHKCEIIEQRKEFIEITLEKFTGAIYANPSIKPKFLEIIVGFGKISLDWEKELLRDIYLKIKSL